MSPRESAFQGVVKAHEPVSKATLSCSTELGQLYISLEFSGAPLLGKILTGGSWARLDPLIITANSLGSRLHTWEVHAVSQAQSSQPAANSLKT